MVHHNHYGDSERHLVLMGMRIEEEEKKGQMEDTFGHMYLRMFFFEKPGPAEAAEGVCRVGGTPLLVTIAFLFIDASPHFPTLFSIFYSFILVNITQSP